MENTQSAKQARIAYYTVGASVPGEPTQIVTTIASGPISAVSAVTRMMHDKHPAHALKRARFTCRSGWIDLDGRRYEPRVDPTTARALGAIA
jgi:hypothetical protein